MIQVYCNALKHCPKELLRGVYYKACRRLCKRMYKLNTQHKKVFIANILAITDPSNSFLIKDLSSSAKTIEIFQDILRDSVKKKLITQSQKNELLNQLRSEDEESVHLALLLIKTITANET